MKLSMLLFIAFILVGLPLITLQLLVMPALQTVQYSYAHASATANAIASAH